MIKYEDLNDVQRILYGDGLTLEAVTIPMINNGLNARQLKGTPDKDGRYFDIDGNKIHASRCWASSVSGQTMLSEPYNAFSEKARHWSSMYGDEEPFLCYSRAYFDYSIDPEDPDAEKVYEWVEDVELVGADVKYVALDINHRSKEILQQVIVEAAAEKDGSFETILEIPKADLMKNEILEIEEDFQGVDYVEFRFRFIKMPQFIKEPVLVDSAMLLREVEGGGLGGGCRPMSFKIGDKFVQEHPNGIGRLRPAFDGDKSWRYIMNKKGCEILYEMLDGQALPKKLPTPVVKPEKTPINNADCGGPNGKTVVTADWDVPAGMKAFFSPELVVGSGHLVGKINSSAAEVVSGASFKAKAALPDDIVIPDNPTYPLEIDNTAGTTKRVGRITTTIQAAPNDVGAIYYLEGCVKFVNEVEGKYQEGETKSKVVFKKVSYNDKSFYDGATCDVVLTPALGTGAGGKFSRKDAIQAEIANIVMGESVINNGWELYINNNPTGVKVNGAGEKVDLKAAILAMGAIPDDETGFVVTFRAVDDNPNATGMAVSRTTTATFEQKPEVKGPVLELHRGDGSKFANKITIARGDTKIDGASIFLDDPEGVLTMADVTYSIVNSTDVNADTTIVGYDAANKGVNVTDAPATGFAIKDLCKPQGAGEAKVATITLKAGDAEVSYDVVVPPALMYMGPVTFSTLNVPAFNKPGDVTLANPPVLMVEGYVDHDLAFWTGALTMPVEPTEITIPDPTPMNDKSTFPMCGFIGLVAPKGCGLVGTCLDTTGATWDDKMSVYANPKANINGVIYEGQIWNCINGGVSGIKIFAN